MSLQYWLVPSPKRNRTHIKDYGKDKLYYYCGLYCSRITGDTLQAPLRTKEMNLCKNCIRVFKARRGVEP